MSLRAKPSANEQHNPLPDASLLNHSLSSGWLVSWASAGEQGSRRRTIRITTDSPFAQKLRFCAAAPFFGSMFTGLRRGPEPAPLCRYRLSRLAWAASRWRLRFRGDRRRRFISCLPSRGGADNPRKGPVFPRRPLLTPRLSRLFSPPPSPLPHHPSPPTFPLPSPPP